LNDDHLLQKKGALRLVSTHPLPSLFLPEADMKKFKQQMTRQLTAFRLPPFALEPLNKQSRIWCCTALKLNWNFIL
jgi:hypothetical protein